MTTSKLAKMLDFAVLKPEKTEADIRAAAALCAQEKIGCLCVRPTDVALAVAELKKLGAPTKVACVVGFPHGASHTEMKAIEAMMAIEEDGAAEIDMVMNIGLFRSRRYAAVRSDINRVAQLTHELGGKLKVILETCLLTPAQIRKACGLCVEAGADFVKTSTGFNGPGATPEAVEIMLDAVKGTGVQVKASGGIRDRATAEAYARMGVTRLGVSGAKEILAR